MYKKTLALVGMLAVALSMPAQNSDTLISKQILKQKVVDDGGSGMFKAIAVKEKGLPDFVIYRPKDFLHTHARQGALPILMFGNGGCADTSIGYERMLTEIASHGYVVVAIGEMQDKRFDRPEGHTPSSELKRGLDWITEQSKTKGSDYYQNVDPERVAAAGFDDITAHHHVFHGSSSRHLLFRSIKYIKLYFTRTGGFLQELILYL